MSMPVATSQTRPHVYTPSVLDIFNLLKGKKNEKEYLVLAGKIYLCHFLSLPEQLNVLSQ